MSITVLMIGCFIALILAAWEFIATVKRYPMKKKDDNDKLP